MSTENKRNRKVVHTSIMRPCPPDTEEEREIGYYGWKPTRGRLGWATSDENARIIIKGAVMGATTIQP